MFLMFPIVILSMKKPYLEHRPGVWLDGKWSVWFEEVLRRNRYNQLVFVCCFDCAIIFDDYFRDFIKIEDYGIGERRNSILSPHCPVCFESLANDIGYNDYIY